VDTFGKPITHEIKAVMHVAMNARSNDVHALMDLCTSNGVALLEDSAQALGSYHNGIHLGTIGHCGSFSFSSPKIISTGQGGALVTNDDALAARIRKLKDFGRSTGGNDTHDVVGWNFKYTDMQGVVGIEQMKKLPYRVERMKQIWQRYCSHLDGLPGLQPMVRHEKVQPG
jgi:perosamine synthetase